MGDFSFRGFVSGNFYKQQNNIVIYAEYGYASVFDTFNFEDDEYLGSWNCDGLSFYYAGINAIGNCDFRNFRERYGVGKDFIVCSKIKRSYNFQPMSFQMED